MITKEQLELLERPLQQNKELHYTIGGTVETVVHSSVDAERIVRRNKGHRIMNEAVQDFRNNMAFKSREGLSKAQFKKSVER